MAIPLEHPSPSSTVLITQTTMSLIDPFRCRFQHGCPVLPGSEQPLKPIRWFAREWNRYGHVIGFHIRHKRMEICESRFDRETYFIVRHWEPGRLTPILVGASHRLELTLAAHLTRFSDADLLGAIDPRVDRFVTIRWFSIPDRFPDDALNFEATGAVIQSTDPPIPISARA